MRATAALLLVQASRAGALVTGSSSTLQCTGLWSSRPRLQSVRLQSPETEVDAFRAFDLGQRSIWGDRSSEDTNREKGVVVPTRSVKPSSAKLAASAAAVQLQKNKAVATAAVAAKPLQDVAAAVQSQKEAAVAMSSITAQRSGNIAATKRQRQAG